MDWALIESWKQKGVPLHVALRGIERAFDSHARRPAAGRRRSIKSLLYCEEEIEAQYAEWLESQTGKQNTNGAKEPTALGAEEQTESGRASASPFPPQVVLDHLTARRAALAELCARGESGEGKLSPVFSETLARVVNRLDELIADWRSAAAPSAERLEHALTGLEGLLDENLRACFDEAELAAEERAAQQQLSAYKARMEPTTYQTTFNHLLMKRLRERRHVPRLSLFHL